MHDGCISFDSYIKPQLPSDASFLSSVVYLLTPTSNHNQSRNNEITCKLYIFWLLHQTTTYYRHEKWILRCISFDSYIKPQLLSFARRYYCVVYLLTPTSNHNLSTEQRKFVQLYIFWLLHQTTTRMPGRYYRRKLYIFWLLHQTTTLPQSNLILAGCISFDSYIKPQLMQFEGVKKKSCISFDSYIKPQPFRMIQWYLLVVYLLTPTSNHNQNLVEGSVTEVVYLLTPTSNHNL